MSDRIDRTTDHPSPPDTLPPDDRAPTDSFDPNRTTGLDPTAPAAGEVLPGYDLQRELGRGGMGIVYRARDTRLNRVVALKMLLGRPGPAELARFRAEAEAMAAVRHPNVAQVFESGEADGSPFLAMELLPGGTLADRLKRDRGLAARAAAGLVGKVATGVAAAHAQGIVHRDLKPGNVLFDADGTPKVTDFGLAKRATGSEVTATGAVMGTPAYMAPEQAGGGSKFVGPQADVWALGVVLYEALTGTRPFPGEDIRSVLTADPVPPRRRTPNVPRDLELVCLKCLSKEPSERYQDAAELAADLGRFARGEPISIRPAGLAERAYKWARRKPAVAGLYAALVAGAVLVGVVAVVARSRQEAVEARGEADAARVRTEDALAAETAARGLADAERRKAETARTTAEELKGKAEQALVGETKAMAALEGALAGETEAKSAAERAFEAEKAAKAAEEALREKVERFEYARSVALAQREVQAGNLSNVRAILDATPERLRGWDWHFVRRQSHPELFVLRGGQPQYSADGTRLVTAGGNRGVVWVWDARTGRELFALPCSGSNGGGMAGVAINADGSRVATVGPQAFQVWDARTGRALFTRPPGKVGTYRDVSISPDGSAVVTVETEGDIRVWDAATGTERFRLSSPFRNGGIRSRPRFTTDGKHLLTEYATLPVPPRTGSKLWDARTGEPIPVRFGDGRGGWAPSADARRVAGFTYTEEGPRARRLHPAWNWFPRGLRPDLYGPVRVWESVTGEEVFAAYPGEPTRTVALNRDGTRLAAVGASGHVRVWNVATGAALATYRGHAGRGPTWVEFTPDGSAVVTSGDGSPAARLWDAASAAELSRFNTSDDSRVDIATPSPDGAHVVAIGGEFTRVWEVAGLAGQTVLSDPGNTAPAGPLARPLNPDGTKFLTAAPYTELVYPVHVADVITGGTTAVFRGHTRRPVVLLFSPDGKRVLSSAGMPNPTTWIWDAATGKPVREFPDQIVLSPDGVFGAGGTRIVTVGVDRAVCVWDAGTGDELLNVSSPAGVPAAALSPDGGRLATLDSEAVKVWDVKTGRVLHAQPLEASKLPAGGSRPLFFSPDGEVVVFQDNGYRTWLWNPRARAVLGPIPGRVSGAGFSPDGRQLVCGDRAGLRVYDVRTGGLSFNVPTPPRDALTRSVECAAFGPDGQRVFALSTDRRLAVWDLVTQTRVLDIAIPGVASDRPTFPVLAVSPDRFRVLVWFRGEPLRILDASPVGREFVPLAAAPPPRPKP